MADGQTRPRVLFVDDEPSIRLTLPPVLQEAGFEVRVSESVPDALFEINTNPYDVLISDLNIGEDGDGFLVVSAMRHVQPGCTNFILTGYPHLKRLSRQFITKSTITWLSLLKLAR